MKNKFINKEKHTMKNKLSNQNVSRHSASPLLNVWLPALYLSFVVVCLSSFTNENCHQSNDVVSPLGMIFFILFMAVGLMFLGGLCVLFWTRHDSCPHCGKDL